LRILGIDPGSRRTGVAVIAGDAGRPALVWQGVIVTPDGDHPARLGVIFGELSDLIAAHRPHEAAVEEVFVSRNPVSALKLGQARGAALCAIVRAGLVVTAYAPTAVKMALVGRGRADKNQVQHMVRLMLGLAAPLAEDAADALAVAICHYHHLQTARRWPVAKSTARTWRQS